MFLKHLKLNCNLYKYLRKKRCLNFIILLIIKNEIYGKYLKSTILIFHNLLIHLNIFTNKVIFTLLNSKNYKKISSDEVWDYYHQLSFQQMLRKYNIFLLIVLKSFSFLLKTC
jgi:hypothetical protein